MGFFAQRRENKMHGPDERQNISNFCEAWGEFLHLVEWGNLLLAIFKWLQMSTAWLTVVFAEHLTRKYKHWLADHLLWQIFKCRHAYHQMCYFSDNYGGDLRGSAFVQVLRASFCNCGHVLSFLAIFVPAAGEWMWYQKRRSSTKIVGDKGRSL